MNRIIIASFIILLAFGCSVQKKYYIKSQDFKDKKIVFSLDEGSSYQKIKKFGEHIGNSKDPNIHYVLKESIEELAIESKIDMVYSPSFVFPADSLIPVIVSIKNIDWIFNDTKATMNVNIEYTLQNNEIITIVGTYKYKIFLAGTKSGNLRKALKDGHKQFLSTLY